MRAAHPANTEKSTFLRVENDFYANIVQILTGAPRFTAMLPHFLFFCYSIHGTRRSAYAAIAAFFFVNAEFSFRAYNYSVKGTFHITGRTADAFFSVYIMCHFTLSMIKLSPFFCA